MYKLCAITKLQGNLLTQNLCDFSLGEQKLFFMATVCFYCKNDLIELCKLMDFTVTFPCMHKPCFHQFCFLYYRISLRLVFPFPQHTSADSSTMDLTIYATQSQARHGCLPTDHRVLQTRLQRAPCSPPSGFVPRSLAPVTENSTADSPCTSSYTKARAFTFYSTGRKGACAVQFRRYFPNHFDRAGLNRCGPGGCGTTSTK